MIPAEWRGFFCPEYVIPTHLRMPPSAYFPCFSHNHAIAQAWPITDICTVNIIHQIQLIQYERQIHHQCADYRCAFGQKVTRQFSLDISKNRNPVLVFLANFLLRKATFWYQYWSYI